MKSASTYLCGWDHDSDLLDSLSELVHLDDTVVVKIEVFERLKENGLLILNSI